METNRWSKEFRFLGWAAAAFLLPFGAYSQNSKGIDLSPLPALESSANTKSAETNVSTPVAAALDPGEPFYVLCYHRFLKVADEDEDLAQAEYQMPVSEFQWQMQYLKENGYHPISQEQLMGYWFQGKPLPLKPVLITFDDGFRTIYTDAFPVIKAEGYPTIFFLYTKFIEYGELALKEREAGVKKHKVKSKTEALKDSDILEMQKSGMIVESHTANHLNLGLENEKRGEVAYQKLLVYELTQPLTFIESRFQLKPEWLAYPYGVYDPAILKETEEAGYKLAFTVNPGPNDRTVPPLMLKRNLILYPISHERFAEIFKDKVLHIKNLYPGDGGVIDSQEPIIAGLIEDEIAPKSVKLQLGDHLMRVKFDPKTKTFQHPVGSPLTQGGHILTMSATSLKGENLVYNWYFRIKHKRYEKKEKTSGDDTSEN